MEYLNGYSWQAWMHGTAEPGTTFDHLDKAVGAWRGRLANISKMRVSSMGFSNMQPQPHVHVLLLGRNKHGHTLESLNEDIFTEMEHFWRTMMHRSCRFSLLKNVPGAVRYIIQNNVIDKHSMVLSPRGLKLLQKSRIQTNNHGGAGYFGEPNGWLV